MDHVYPGTGMGMPPAEYEAKIRSLHPEAAKWGPSQINAIFTYLSNNSPLPVDTEEEKNFAGDWDSEDQITKERRVYWLGIDGDPSNPAHYKWALNISGYSSAPGKDEQGLDLGFWKVPDPQGVERYVYFQSGAGMTFSCDSNPIEWFDRNSAKIAAVTSIVLGVIASVGAAVATILTLGGLSPLLIGAVGLTASLATAAGLILNSIVKVVDGIKHGNYTEILQGLSDFAKGVGAFAKVTLDRLKKSDPKTFEKLTAVADKVSIVYDKVAAEYKKDERSVEAFINSAKEIGTKIKQISQQSFDDARDLLGPSGQVMFDKLMNVDTNDLPDFAATHVPWYMQDIAKIVGIMKATQESQSLARKGIRFNPGFIPPEQSLQSRGMMLAPSWIIAAQQEAKLTVDPAKKTYDKTASGQPLIHETVRLADGTSVTMLTKFADNRIPTPEYISAVTPTSQKAIFVAPFAILATLLAVSWFKKKSS